MTKMFLLLVQIDRIDVDERRPEMWNEERWHTFDAIVHRENGIVGKNHLQLKTCALHVATKHIENVVTIDKNKSVT